MDTLTPGGFLARLVASFALVALTYNPSGHSFVHWMAGTLPHVLPLQAVAGLFLLGGWGLFLHATWRSLGATGVLLVAAFAAALVWLVSSWGWVNLQNGSALVWIVLAVASLILAVGLSWSGVRRRVTGQTDVEEIGRR
jgi:NADH:ubiquinone oxidoreductase subunit K